MTQYYISMAFRNLRKRPGFYAVNIAGLAIGLAACLMITHYVRFHNSYDTYQPDSERVYRICYSRWGEGGDNKVEFASATPVIGRLLKENFPEIEKQGQAFRLEGIYSYEDRFFEEKRAFQAESDLLDLLGVNIIEGRKINILDEPATMVMSRSAAGKYFGDESPIGKTIYHNRNTLYEVVAVFEDLPANTHFKADMFLSLETWKQQNPNLFQNGYIFSGFFNYIKLAEGVDAGLMNEKITEFVNQTYAEAFEAGQFTMGFKLQPLQSIHLNSHFMHELELNGNAASIQYLEIVAWFILVIAWVNFFNLSTIASIRRLREISIRKVNGAQRRNLIQQFLIESAVINGFAIMMALVIYELASPVFYNFADLPPGLSAWKQPWFYTLVAIAFVAGTFSAGIYSVSDIRTSRLVEYLKGVSLGIKGKRTTRKMLVGLQFAIAMGLIAATTVIYKQYQLISDSPLGFKAENMLVVNAPLLNSPDIRQQFEIMKTRLDQVPGFGGATFSSIIPGKPNMYNRGGVYLYGSEPTSGKNYRITEADHQFFKVLDIKIIAGEDFTGYHDIDMERVILNKTAAQWAGFENFEDAVGNQLVLEQQVLTIAGIADDFHQLSPKEAIEPQIFRIPRRFGGHLTMDIGNTPPKKAIEEAEAIFKEMFPSDPFHYYFLDDYYQSQNLAEKRFGVVFLLFSSLVIIITIMGLMSLSAYTAEQKKKEIGIRKVLGANSASIFRLMFKEYIYLWAIGAVIAIPAVYYLIERWLASFALRIEPGFLFLVLPLATVLIVALITVFVQSEKILHMNPVESIRSE